VAGVHTHVLRTTRSHDSTVMAKAKRGDMKKQLVQVVLMLVTLGCMSGLASVHAQTSYGVKAQVPFDFYVGDKLIQAGAITAQSSAPADGPILISNSANEQFKLRPAVRMQANGRSEIGKLVFHKYQDRYYLSQVWVSGSVGRELVPSKSEKALARERRSLAKNASEPEVITVVGH
jgi:hypothetical protein